MAGHVLIVAGPARSGKSFRLLNRYRTALAEGAAGLAAGIAEGGTVSSRDKRSGTAESHASGLTPQASSLIGETLWISPTARAAAGVRENLLASGLRACFAPNVFTFEAFAQAILDHAPELVRPLYGMARRQLIARLADDLTRNGKLKYFERIAHTPGFVDLLSGFLSEMKRHEIWPEAFLAACERRGRTAKDEALFAFYDTYQAVLARRQLFDAEGRFWTARTLLDEGHRRPFERLRLVVADGFADFTATQHDILSTLAGYADALIVSLPLEREERRGDLFAKPRATLEELTRRLPTARVEWVERSGEGEQFEEEERALWEASPFAESASSEVGGSVGERIRLPQQPAFAQQPGFPLDRWPAMVRLERYLLGDPRAVLPPLEEDEGGLHRGCHGGPRSARPTLRDVVGGADGGVEIVAAAQQLGEVQTIAARIKRLLLEGDSCDDTKRGESKSPTPVRPQDIVVVFRSTDSVAALVREVFDEYGIPFVLDCRPLLGESPLVKALLAVLALDAEDWPFRRALAVLTNNYVAPPGITIAGDRAANLADVQAAAERVVRAMQMPSGRAKLLERWRRMAAASGAEGDDDAVDGDTSPADDDDLALVRRRARRNRAAAVSFDYVESVARALAELPDKATPAGWAAALERLAAALGMSGGGEWGSLDAAAWRRLLEVLRAGSRLSEWLDEPAETWSRAELRDRLDEIVAAETIPLAADECGRVRVLSAPAVRTLSVPYLFVASLSEHEFPRRARDEVLYHEADRRRLAEEGLRLPRRSDRASEEMLLFYEVVTRATRRLVLSYPAMNEKAEPLLASPFLLDVKRILPGAESDSDAADLRPIPRERAGYSPSDRRVLAMHEALDDRNERLVALVGGEAALGGSESGKLDPVGENLIAALRTNESHKGQIYGPMEGMFTSAAAKRHLAARYGPERVWSASQFEAYAYCPMRYFFEHVLHLEPPEEIELAADSRQRGRLLHAALAGAHRGLNESLAGPSSPHDGLEAFRRGYLEQLRALAEQFRRDTELDAALIDIDAKLLADLIDQYVAQHAEYDALPAALRPAHFEVSFGFPVDDGPFVDPLSTPTPLVLRRGGEEIRIGGRIDRIDRLDDDRATAFGVVDYKTGNPIKKKARAEQADDGRRLQLDLYALAVEQVLLADRQSIGVHTGYWHVSVGGFDVWQAMHERAGDAWQPTEDWQRRRERLVELVFSLARGIRDGQFPMHAPDEECTSFCAFKTVCRVHQARSLEKSWRPPVNE